MRLRSSFLGCDEYSIPETLKNHIDLIAPTVHMNTIVKASPRPKKLRRRGPSSDISPKRYKLLGKPMNPNQPLPGCDVGITIDCLRALYNFHYTPKATEKNSYGVGM